MTKYIFLTFSLALILSCDKNKHNSQTVDEKVVNKPQASIRDKAEPKEIGKQMYGVVLYSTFSPILNDKTPNFTDIFIVDSEISKHEEKEIIDKKIDEVLQKNPNEKVFDKKLKCFDTMDEVHKYIDNFRLGTTYRPTDFTTFDSVPNYTDMREFSRNYHNIK